MYAIFVDDAATAVTLPEAFTVAAAVLLLLHAPPVLVVDKVIEECSHTCCVPVGVAGSGLTVTVVLVVVEQPAAVDTVTEYVVVVDGVTPV